MLRKFSQLSQKHFLKPGYVSARIQKYNQKNPDNQINLVIKPPAPAGLYVPFQREGRNKLIFSGFGSKNSGGNICGRVGHSPGDLAEAEGIKAAEEACMIFLRWLAIACGGDLDGVNKILSLNVFVQCNPADTQLLSSVANGASQRAIDVFGEYIGKPTRTTTGPLVPANLAVEITVTVEICDELAAELDFNEAKILSEIVCWSNSFTRASLNENIIRNLFSNNVLTQKSISYLEDWVIKTINCLSNLDETVFTEALDSLKAEETEAEKELLGYLDRVQSKQDLINLLIYKLKNLLSTRKTIAIDTNARLSEQSEMFGSRKNKPIKTAAAVALSAAAVWGGYWNYQRSKF